MATAAESLPQTAPPLGFDVPSSEHDDGLPAFLLVRPRLFGIAYRILGNAAEAEDIVQEVWLRWQGADRNAVENPPAFLATTTTRMCINLVQSAHSRRETSIGTWLHEPVDSHGDPGLSAERDEGLKQAVLLLLKKLSPTERATYILREAFDYSYRQIADVLQMEEANARQLVSRARKHIADGRCTPVSSGEQLRLLQAFVAAAQNGDMAPLEDLFVEDVVCCSDGGEIMRAEPTPISGRKRVTSFIADVASHFWKREQLGSVETSGQGGHVMSSPRGPIALPAIDVSVRGADQRMKCDLCNRFHTTGNLLCSACADMIHRVATVDARMHNHDACEAERLAGTAFGDASESPKAMSY